MTIHSSNSHTYTYNPERIAIQVLREMTTQQRQERRVSLQELSDTLEVPIAVLVPIQAALDRQGFIDRERMSVTMVGFVTGLSLLRRRTLFAAYRRLKKLVASASHMTTSHLAACTCSPITCPLPCPMPCQMPCHCAVPAMCQLFQFCAAGKRHITCQPQGHAAG